jgi:hypothetical protein
MKKFSIKRMKLPQPVLHIHYFEVELELTGDLPSLNGVSTKTYQVMRFRDGHWSIGRDETQAGQLRPEKIGGEPHVFDNARSRYNA